MKEIFFKGLVIALPVCVVGGLLYAIFIGFYSLYEDMRLKRELDQISREAEQRRKQETPSEVPPTAGNTVEDLFKK